MYLNSSLNLIHLSLEPEEDTGTIEMSPITDAVEDKDKLRLVADLILHEVIKAKCNQNAQHQHNIQLNINRAAGHVAEPPA